MQPCRANVVNRSLVVFDLARLDIRRRFVSVDQEDALNPSTNDTFFVRTARSISRRATLLGIGGATFVAVPLPQPARGGKAGKKAKKKCKKQIGKCQASVTSFCARPLSVDQETCEAMFLPCCQSFKGCKAGAVYDCIGDALLALLPPKTPV
jgi:hypothetical protein